MGKTAIYLTDLDMFETVLDHRNILHYNDTYMVLQLNVILQQQVQKLIPRFTANSGTYVLFVNNK
jgi:hypothetical protein